MDPTTLDKVAIVGYSSWLIYSLYKLQDTIKRPFDFVANIILIIALVALIKYHYKHLTTGKDVQDDKEQRQYRLVAHGAFVIFLFMTLSSFSAANFQNYDWFAVFGNIALYVTVWGNITQLSGLVLLALYFAFASMQKIGKGGMEILQLIARVALLIFFVVASFIEVKNLKLV